MEFTILNYIQENLRSPIMDSIMVFISALGNGGLVWIIISFLLFAKKKYRKWGIILLISLFIGLIIGNVLLKPLIARPRPYWLCPEIDLLIEGLKDYSFPSGHTLSSFIAATVLTFANRKFGLLAGILAFLIAFSRLYLYVHFPSDVFGGIFLGILIGVAVCFLYRKYWENRNHEKDS